ncbi:MAG: phosphatidate cytidylyltransferase [Elusimicrobiaceae bacterium]|nr:phosphatidate cytidylyltransferase [Elusimicrobiaceae bacterium]
MLIPRVLTALVGIPLILGSIHFGGAVYACFVAAVVFLSLHEYGLILWTGRKPVSRVALLLFGALAAFGAVAGRMPAGGIDNLVPLVISLVVLGLLSWEVLTPKRSLERFSNTMAGVFLVAWPLAHLVNVRALAPYGEYYTFMLFLTVWACDTAAYFGGRAFGSRKLNPEVSPKKTWEGSIAGFLAAVAVSALLRAILVPGALSVTDALVLGALAGVCGQISDLAESVIKRSAGVKDSSNLLPGHGGVLDRFDSYLLLAPVYYYALVFMGK